MILSPLGIAKRVARDAKVVLIGRGSGQLKIDLIPSQSSRTQLWRVDVNDYLVPIRNEMEDAEGGKLRRSGGEPRV